MTLTAPFAPALDPVATPVAPAGGADAAEGRAAYRALTGAMPDEAAILEGHGFDRHVLASILAVAAAEGGPVAARAGLADGELAALLAQWFPALRGVPDGWDAAAGPDDDDEAAMVRDLLLGQRSSAGDTGRWLAAMIARRAMEPNHLWEDLGLRNRGELTRLIARHFAPLAARNTRNMRWKRFFYRMLCEDDGFVMCSTPVCTECTDFDTCFGDESGESRMADRRRNLALAAAGHAGTPPLSSGPSR